MLCETIKIAFENNVKVICVDPKRPFTRRDEEMAKNIGNIIEKNPGIKILFYGGASHAANTSYIQKGGWYRDEDDVALYTSLGKYLKTRYSSKKTYTIILSSDKDLFPYFDGGWFSRTFNLPSNNQIEKMVFALDGLKETIFSQDPWLFTGEEDKWEKMYEGNNMPSWTKYKRSKYNMLGNAANGLIFLGATYPTADKKT